MESAAGFAPSIEFMTKRDIGFDTVSSANSTQQNITGEKTMDVKKICGALMIGATLLAVQGGSIQAFGDANSAKRYCAYEC